MGSSLHDCSCCTVLLYDVILLVEFIELSYMHVVLTFLKFP